MLYSRQFNRRGKYAPAGAKDASRSGEQLTRSRIETLQLASLLPDRLRLSPSLYCHFQLGGPIPSGLLLE